MKKIILLLILVLFLYGCDDYEFKIQDLKYYNCSETAFEIAAEGLEYVELEGEIKTFVFEEGSKSAWAYKAFIVGEHQYILEQGYWGTINFFENYELNMLEDGKVSIKGYLGEPDNYILGDPIKPLYLTEIQGYSPKCCVNEYGQNHCFWVKD